MTPNIGNIDLTVRIVAVLAISLVFGILVSTLLTLILNPVL